MVNEKEFEKLVLNIFDQKAPKKIAVAVSGGADSMALLSLLNDIFGEKVEIYCLTVNHKTRENSAKDADFVADFCAQNSISCHILESNLEHIPEVNIENSLRLMRYELMGDFCQKNKIKHLFLGHHQDDLAENFLIRLFRGSGIDGLAAMNKITNFQEIKLIRPFLEFSKTDLTQYLQNKKISWVEDESNEDEKFLRNKIRNFLKNLPDSEIINSRISLASNAILEAKEILQKETKKNFPKIFRKCDVGFLLDLEKFRKLEKMVATRYLSFALMKISQRIYKPRFKKLERIYQLILDGKLSKKEEFYGCLIEGASEEFCRELSGAFMGAGTLLLRPKT